MGVSLASHDSVAGVLVNGSSSTRMNTLVDGAQAFAAKLLRVISPGSSTAIVSDDADLRQAAYSIVIGACAGTGQLSATTRHVLVHQRVAKSLTEHLVHLLGSARIGYSLDDNVFLGSLISEQAERDYLSHVASIASVGDAELLLDGHPASYRSTRRGFYVTPSLCRISLDALVANGAKETCHSGPLLTISSINSLEQGIERLNDEQRWVASSIFSRNRKTLDLVAETVRGGLVLFNSPSTDWPTVIPVHPHGLDNAALPWGTLAIRSCTQLVSTVEAAGGFDPTSLPPGLQQLAVGH